MSNGKKEYANQRINKMINLKGRKINPYWYDFEKILKIARLLGNLKKPKAFSLLISLLDARTPFIRDAAAIILYELKDNRAKPYLIKAINKPWNKNNRGTLVHALTYLDCRDLFLFFVQLALSNEYETQSHALNALYEQYFMVKESDVKNAELMIEKYIKSKNKCKDYKLLIDELRTLIKSKKESLPPHHKYR